jgi:drug/metabolite transporter (DMT)-like permease
MPLRLIPMLLALAWGLNWPAVKIMLAVIPPFALRGLGLGGGALVLALLAASQRRPLWPARAAWPGIAMGAFSTVMVFNFATALAQLSTSTSRAAVLTFTTPMMAAALAWVFLGERPGRRGGWALALGGLGVAVLAEPVLDTALRGGLSAAQARGLLLPLLAAFSWASGTVMAKRWPPQGDRIVVTAWQLGLGSVAGLLISLAIGERVPAVWPGRVALAMAYHVLIATAVAYVLWYRLLASASATAASLAVLAVPVVGVLGAMLLVGDRPSPADWLGFGLVLGGAALVVLKLPGRAPTSAP